MKDIPGFEGRYAVTEDGRVWSYPKSTNNTKGQFLKGYTDRYTMVRMNRRHFLLHRVVAETFIPNPDNLPCVNHKDGSKDNNKVENLEWVSFKENMKHAEETGLWLIKGERHWRSKLTSDDVLEIRKLYATNQWTQLEIAKKFGVSRGAVMNVLLGRSWSHV